MYKGIIISFVLFGLFPPLYSQKKEIKGIVCSSDNEPVSYATVILQSVDSTFINATITDSLGVYRFDDTPSPYRLIIQHLIYETKEVASTNRPEIIYLSPKEYDLDQVVITAERPIVRVNNGILTYDVEQVTQNKTVSNAYEALLRLPGVTEVGGSISLTGADKITIILNGKPSTMGSSQLIELLKQMPVSYIESAEVMYSTPPQYHTRGAAINLVTREINDEQESPVIQGEFNGAYNQRHYVNYNTGTSFLYSYKKLSADFLYSYSDGKEKTGMDVLSRHKFNGITHEINQYNIGKNEAQIHRVRLGLDYNKKTSFVYNVFVLNNGRANELSTGNFSESKNLKIYKQQMHNLSLDYYSDSGFKIGTSYTYFKNPSTQFFTENNKSSADTKLISDSQQEIHNVLLYIDNINNLKNNWQLTYGGKFSHAKDHDFQLYKNTPENFSLTNTDNTIKEYIYDIYIGIGKQFSEKLSLNLSLTGEYYKLATDHEWALFPQAQITYIPYSAHLFQFAISSDKQYPGYWEKQNYKAFLNGYAEVHGNPELKPYNNYTAQLAYINNRKYIFALYCIYQPDYAVQLAYQASDKLSLIYKTLNWDYNQRVGFNIVLPLSSGNWFDSQATFNGFYHKARSKDFHDISFENDKFIGYAAIDNTFNICSKPNIKLDISVFYMTEPIQGIYDMSSIYNVDAGVKWIFANEKAEIRIKAQDIFNSSTPDMHIKKSGQDFDMFLVPDNRTIQFSFTYKFGGFKHKERKTIDRSRFGHQ